MLITPLSVTQLLVFGCLGALFVEALKHVRKLQGRQLPDRFDILVSVILIGVGGGVAAIYQGQVQSMLIAAQVGASAPAIIGAWASGGPPPSKGGGTQAGADSSIVLLQTDFLPQVLRALSWRPGGESPVRS